MTWAKIMVADARDPKGSRLDHQMEEWDVEGAEEILGLCNPNRAEGVDAEFVAGVLRVVGPVSGMERVMMMVSLNLDLEGLCKREDIHSNCPFFRYCKNCKRTKRCKGWPLRKNGIGMLAKCHVCTDHGKKKKRELMVSIHFCSQQCSQQCSHFEEKAREYFSRIEQPFLHVPIKAKH